MIGYFSELEGSLQTWIRLPDFDLVWGFKIGEIVKLDVWDSDFWLITDRLICMNTGERHLRIVPYFDFNEIKRPQAISLEYYQNRLIKCKQEDLSILLIDKDANVRKTAKNILGDMND